LKIKHISRINISDKYKTIINSPEVHLGIKRSDAEVEHKNLFIFTTKKSFWTDLS
jgi:phage gp36-like protein